MTVPAYTLSVYNSVIPYGQLNVLLRGQCHRVTSIHNACSTSELIRGASTAATRTMCIHASCNNNRVVRILHSHKRCAVAVYHPFGMQVMSRLNVQVHTPSQTFPPFSSSFSSPLLSFLPSLPPSLLRILRAFVMDYSAFRVALEHDELSLQ